MTSTFARWRSDLTELRGQMASVAGLAPARLHWKDGLRELLCIHGQNGLDGSGTGVAAHGRALTPDFLLGDVIGP